MAALPMVKELNVLRDLTPRLVPGLIAPVMDQFILQRPPKTFHRRIVVTVAPPTHGRGHTELA